MRRPIFNIPSSEMPGPGDVYERRQQEEDTQLADTEPAECLEEPEPREWQPCDGDHQP